MAQRHCGHTAGQKYQALGAHMSRGTTKPVAEPIPHHRPAPPPPAPPQQPRFHLSLHSCPRLLVPAGPGLETACPLFALRGLASLLPNALGFFWSRGWGRIFCCLAPRHGWYSEGSRKPDPDKCRV